MVKTKCDEATGLVPPKTAGILSGQPANQTSRSILAATSSVASDLP